MAWGSSKCYINISVLLLFSVINIKVFKYILCQDISRYVFSYSITCGLIVETASDHIIMVLF